MVEIKNIHPNFVQSYYSNTIGNEVIWLEKLNVSDN